VSSTESAVITGIGCVSAAGCGVDLLRAQFGGTGVSPRPVDRSGGYHAKDSARTAFLVDDGKLTGLVPPLTARRMCRPSKFAVAAARLAVEHAGLDTSSTDSVAVIMSTTFGPSLITEKIIRQILQEGPEATSPSLFTESVANAPAAQVAIALGAKGANITITQRQAGPLMALARGAREVLSGRAEAALVGSVDEVTPLLHAILDRFGALARPRGGFDEIARPFDRGRDGSHLGEGCTVLVIENERTAATRGAGILARVRVGGRSFDPNSPPTGWSPDASVFAGAIKRNLESCGISLASIDQIVCGASGSRPGDRLEARVIRKVWSNEGVPDILAPKAYLGDFGGATLAGAALAMSGARFAPTPGFVEIDPELSVAPYDGHESRPPSILLATSFAAGGAASWTVLEHPNR
jgi:3-oxoacyl-[acyl-carrier-protein] synthase II